MTSNFSILSKGQSDGCIQKETKYLTHGAHSASLPNLPLIFKPRLQKLCSALVPSSLNEIEGFS